MEEGPCQASNNRVCSLFCAIVFALEAFFFHEKSLWLKSSHSALSPHPVWFIFQGRLTPLHLIKGVKRQWNKSEKLKIHSLEEYQLRNYVIAQTPLCVSRSPPGGSVRYEKLRLCCLWRYEHRHLYRDAERRTEMRREGGWHCCCCFPQPMLRVSVL